MNCCGCTASALQCESESRSVFVLWFSVQCCVSFAQGCCGTFCIKFNDLVRGKGTEIQTIKDRLPNNCGVFFLSYVCAIGCFCVDHFKKSSCTEKRECDARTSFPAVLSMLTRLQNAYLYGNSFTGTLPLHGGGDELLTCKGLGFNPRRTPLYFPFIDESGNRFIDEQQG